jgi:hypothetical protein
MDWTRKVNPVTSISFVMHGMAVSVWFLAIALDNEEIHSLSPLDNLNF